MREHYLVFDLTLGAGWTCGVLPRDTPIAAAPKPFPIELAPVDCGNGEGIVAAVLEGAPLVFFELLFMLELPEPSDPDVDCGAGVTLETPARPGTGVLPVTRDAVDAGAG